MVASLEAPIFNILEQKINSLLSLFLNKLAHIFLEEEIQWLFERLSKEKALYHHNRLHDRIPSLVFIGLVLVEDKRFYDHLGIDIRAMLRSVQHCFKYGVIEGASTIEQQLTRVLTNRFEKSFTRKVHEALLASCIHEVFPDKKDNDILGIYLNLVNFGEGMIGIEKACSELGYKLEELERPPEVADLIARIKYPEPLIETNHRKWREKIKNRKERIATLLLEQLLVEPRKEKYDYWRPNSKENKLLVERYPSPQNFFDVVKSIDEKGKEFLIRSFVSEGIPCVFKKASLYYENTREFIAETLSINPKDVLVVGSRKLGYSLCPEKYGACVNEKSDLDLAIISQRVFQKLEKEFLRWEKDYRSSKILAPANGKLYWDNNMKELPDNISKGFIDSNKIPALYPLSKNIRSLCINLEKEINQSCQDSDIPPIPEEKVSMRIYKDWPSFFRQNILNLDYLLKDRNRLTLLGVDKEKRYDSSSMDRKI